MVESAYSAFSPRLGGIVREFFDKNWIDAAFMPNKRGGAFASPTVPSAHPFVFMNYLADPRRHDARARTRPRHPYVSFAEAQSFTGLYTPLTTAEMASTFGEMLIFTARPPKNPTPLCAFRCLRARLKTASRPSSARFRCTVSKTAFTLPAGPKANC